MFIQGVTQDLILPFPSLIQDLINDYLRDYYYQQWRTQINLVNIEIKSEAKNRIKIRQFDLSQIPKNNTIVVYGHSKSGKTTIIKDFLYLHKSDIPLGMVISPTIQREYQDIVPDTMIHQSYDSQLLANLMDRQQRTLTRGLVGYRHNSFLVMDDIYPRNLHNDSYFCNLMINGGHFQTTTLISSQYRDLRFASDIRRNFNFVFLGGTGNETIKHQIYHQYAGMFPDYNSFSSVFKACTSSPYSFMVINQSAFLDPKIENQVFWYRDRKSIHQRIWNRKKINPHQLELIRK